MKVMVNWKRVMPTDSVNHDINILKKIDTGLSQRGK